MSPVFIESLVWTGVVIIGGGLFIGLMLAVTRRPRDLPPGHPDRPRGGGMTE